MGKIREKVGTAAYLRHYYSYWLKNNEDGTILLFYKNSGGSPWINRYAEAESWLREKEQACLNIDNIKRPNTKWVFMGYFNVDVKVVLDHCWAQAPCQTGCESLHMVGRWYHWTPTRTTCISGAALQHTAVQDQIEAQEQHKSLQRVSLNSKMFQTTSRKHLWMNSIWLKDA